MSIKETFFEIVRHPAFHSPAISLGLTAFSLLLLVLVLQSVPGPIRGMFWFSIPGESTGSSRMLGGVMGWCMDEFANCTYAPLSENPFLADKIDAGRALTVRIMLPLACYWSIITLVAWVLLCVFAPGGYEIKNMDSISRHLFFAVAEACVLCISLFSNVLCWLAFGLGNQAFLTIKAKGVQGAKSGRALEVAAVAALVSLFALFTAIWGLRLRLQAASRGWKQEATLLRRRSMAMTAAGIPTDGRGNRLSSMGEVLPLSDDEKKRWSSVSDMDKNGAYLAGLGLGETQAQAQRPAYSAQQQLPVQVDEEERLDDRLALARRNSIDHATLKRASVIGHHNDAYSAATGQQVHHYQSAV